MTTADLRTLLEQLPSHQRRRFARRIAGAEKVTAPRRRRAALDAIAADLETTVSRRNARRLAVPDVIRYPAELPITDRREELLDAIANHQVVIVAGETGSGKSTQLPKMCIELGRGVDGWIGHTQPRRIAARSIADRVAKELGSSVGDVVGYKVRFSDQVGERTLVKLMTDGVLLAEIHHDRLLRRYDTIILDEAHERSLNIDFLLGYLKTILPKRPDLKVIITSATIDTERFAAHFDDAPIIEVSGRTYPVEIRYRPLDDATSPEPRDQPQAICDAVVELTAEGPGDILVFCAGEREIRDAADALEELGLRHTEILPLYARLSVAEQQRVFAPHTGRRIVLATNVAETSLTVPGIRYVVDPGTARISRYSRRTRVQQLPIEPISQASANQRAGRCGRLGPGICIRLYTEDDFNARPEFTEPEIQRTHLASVLLQMMALELGDIETFPFLDPPDRRAIRDGVALLEELQAIRGPGRDGDPKAQRRKLTKVGSQLARMPLDPRLGRMVIEGGRNGCLREIAVIAAAMSIQDPRERPEEKRQQADQLHARFRHPGSDFLGWLDLWAHIHQEKQARTSRGFRKMCRDEFLAYRRVREWQDVHRQIREVAAELGLRPNRKPADPDIVHLSMLTGLLSQVGRKDPDRHEYRGARGARFWLSPASVLFKKSPPWLMAGELVETTRMWAHQAAAIDPAWIEQVGAHLIRRTYSDPWWDVERGSAVARETATMLGIPLAQDRVVQYGKVDPAAARELFIRHALVAGEWETHHDFVRRNEARIAEVLEIETRERRGDLLVGPEELYRFFDARIPADVVSTRHFDRWWREAKQRDPHLLDLTPDDLVAPEAAGPDAEAFPTIWRYGDLSLPLEYTFDPGDPADGVTIVIPLEAIDRIDPAAFEWNVPGLRQELFAALLRTLPKPIRRRLVPVPDTARELAAALDPSAGRLLPALRRAIGERFDVEVPPDAFDLEAVPSFVRPRYRIVGAEGETLAEGADLDVLRDALRQEARQTVAAARHDLERDGITTWDFGALPRTVQLGEGAHAITAFPALVDNGDSVSIRLLATVDEQADAMWSGVRRLLLLRRPLAQRALRDLLDPGDVVAVRLGPHETVGAWADDVIGATIDAVMFEAGGPAWDAVEFDALWERIRRDSPERAEAIARRSVSILRAAADVRERLDALPDRFDDVAADVASGLGRLVYPGFITAIGARRLTDVERYVRALDHRLERLPERPEQDRAWMARVHALEAEHDRLVDLLGPTPELIEIAWMLEELRVSLFAQHLGTRGKISEKRVWRALADAER